MGNFIKQTSLPQSQEFSLGCAEYPAVFPFNNDQVQLFCEQYQLTAREVADMHVMFCSIDVEFLGFITIEGFLKLLKETESSIVYPYLKGIFKLVKKKEQGKVDFFEWMAMVIDFCLMTRDQILKFLFRVIDTNDDEIISKKDILKFFSQKNDGKRIFPLNYLKLIELLEIERSDYIPKHEFVKVANNVPFLVYPAVRLQQDMRNLIIGETFWDALVKRLADHESKIARAKQMQAFEDDENRKKREKDEKKEQEMFEVINKMVKEIRAKEVSCVKKADFFVRFAGRRASQDLNRPKCTHFSDLQSLKKDRSVKKLPRYYK